ncbi:MAG: hypothetical protein PWP03_17 [Candidatus Woesearchaeota archaeon]|nr:hypothetical protein [Candidatus Woesearchaeota archaeon]MDN5327379.1 hypothetical protein [Candidatus Woesearchaeota archaeon]
MKITLDLDKDLNQNANQYFEKAKKLKKKAEKINQVIEEFSKKLEQLDKETQESHVKTKKPKPEKAEKKWFERFRWFFSSQGFLVIAGRDATTNEILIKKHTNSDDLVLHTELPGSPFTVIKSEGKEIDEKTIEEAAVFTASYSKAWDRGLSYLDVFYVKPEQVSKKTESGEYMGKGSFMIRGTKHYISAKIELYIGKLKTEDKIMAGPKSAISKHCIGYVQIIPGNDKRSDAAKKINKILKFDDLDEIIRVLPGKVRIVSTFIGKE